MDTGFLPEGYEVPKSSGGGYMKLRTGANKFRVLSAPVMGWQYWNEDGKPVRAKQMWTVVPADADLNKGWPQKHFWAFVVWNFDTKAVEILQLTQATIQSAIQELINNEDWGDPRQYSITINRKGEALETEYSVVPSPAKETPPEVLQAYKEKPINLDALFSGENPFDTAQSDISHSKDTEPLAENEPAF